MDADRLVPMFDEATIAARVRELAARIRADHLDTPLLFICVLKGSILFCADLMRALGDHHVEVAFLAVKSYEGTRSTGSVRLIHDLDISIEDRHCIIVEDIVDTGLTLNYLRNTLELRNPASLKIVSLLDKPERRKVAIEPDYVGFVIPDRFVIGYGLDFDERYRNLPYVAVYQGDAS